MLIFADSYCYPFVYLSYAYTKLQKLVLQTLLITISLVLSPQVCADVVKPALIDISVNELGEIDIEARVSIEALLTGINAQYKNTKEAPNEAEYDTLRKMPSEALEQAFTQFEPEFLAKIRLDSFVSSPPSVSSSPSNKGNHESNDAQLVATVIPLVVTKIKIPEPGYTKVPRISTVQLAGKVPRGHTFIRWYYPAAFGDNAVRLKQVNHRAKKYHWSEWQWLRQNQPSVPFSISDVMPKKPIYTTLYEYLALGFKHILPKGLDHILFILGLFLFATAVNAGFHVLLWQITMFTVAHTITLGLSINGVIALPAHIVEPLIALSIVYVGIENIRAKQLNKSRLLLVFLFGLLHGIGFAAVLADFGMPSGAFIFALISFNIGVELGQIAILIAAYVLIGFWFTHKSWYRASVMIPCSLLISAIACYWFIERLEW